MFKSLICCAALVACLVLVPGCKSDAPPQDTSPVPGAMADPTGAYDYRDAGLGGRGTDGLLPGSVNDGSWVDKGQEGRIGDAFLFDMAAQLAADLLCGGYAHVAHDQQLFQFFKQILVDPGEGMEHKGDLPADRVACLFQAFFDFIKQSHGSSPLL